MIDKLSIEEERDANMLCSAYYDLFRAGQPTKVQLRQWIKSYRFRETKPKIPKKPRRKKDADQQL